MNTQLHQQWPDDYKSWTGNLKELIDTANGILSKLTPLEAPLNVNERLVRFYQNEKAVGKGEKQGRQAIFSFQDLFDLVTTKMLAKTTTLKGASMLNESYGETLYYNSSSTHVTAQAAVTPESSSEAMDLVQRLLSKGPQNHHQYASPSAQGPVPNTLKAILNGSSIARSLSPVASNLNEVVQSLNSVSHCNNPDWLNLNVDLGKMMNASAEEKLAAQKLLEETLKMLKKFS